jgi:hypothetical protein
VETKCVAAALHIDHWLNTDHRVALADMDKSYVEDQEEEDEEPNDQVKWRAFRELCQTAARQPEEWEKLQNQVIEMLGEGSEGRGAVSWRESCTRSARQGCGQKGLGRH